MAITNFTIHSVRPWLLERRRSRNCFFPSVRSSFLMAANRSFRAANVLHHKTTCLGPICLQRNTARTLACMIVSPVHNSKGRAIAHNQITGHGLLASSGLRKHPPGRPGVQQGCKLKAPLLCAACGAHAREGTKVREWILDGFAVPKFRTACWPEYQKKNNIPALHQGCIFQCIHTKGNSSLEILPWVSTWP